jgi:2-polyprenyl-3-methyl-5-hydroxy-6-metoxy-1,4-benzoquinol methylase
MVHRPESSSGLSATDVSDTPWTLVAHPEYGFLQIHPTPTPDEITRYYSAEFYSGDYKQLNDSSLEIQARDRDFYDAQRADVCDRLEDLLGPLTGLTLLDVGCGWGDALAYFSKRGFSCAGFDPAPEAVNHAQSRSLEVVVAGVERMDVFAPRRFDVVTLLNVLEHLADPVAVVRQIREDVLTPGGVLVVDVPNEFNALQRAARSVLDLDEWWVAPPAHLNYFSGSTLRAMLEGEGFDVPIAKASFPMEIFLLFGDNYVTDSAVGHACHRRRMAFEANVRAAGEADTLDRFYRALAALDLGRQVTAFARAQGGSGRPL